MTPYTDIDEIKLHQGETSEAVTMILKKGSLGMGGLRDISTYIKRVNVGGSLNIVELLHIADFLRVAKRAKNYGQAEGKNDSFPILEPRFNAIELANDLDRDIERSKISPTEVSDDASSTLREIRRNIKISNDRIKEQLNSIIHSASYRNMLQDPVITIRNDRYCVPVKQEYKNAFSGMIHDQSATGATVFIEPMSVVNLNNRIAELLSNEKVEIERILALLSSKVAEYDDLLLSNQEILADLDFVFAKGELSISMKATEPIFNTKGYINIKKARHPFLNPETVVPTNIYIDKDAVLRSGMMLPEAIRHLKGEELRDAIPDKLSISLKDIRLLTKVDLLMLEILANCNWERPLYMAISVGNSGKLKFDDYFVQEGLAFRFTPFNYKEWGDVEEGNGYAIDTEKLYENVMNRYKYGGLDTPGLYLDETTLRICYSHRRLFAQLAKELVKQGDDIRARKVLEYAGQAIPAYNVPEVYESGSYDIATAYASIGETQKATELLNHLIAESENYIDWAFSLGDNRIEVVQRDCLYRFWQWNQCNELLKNMDKERYEQSNQQFEKKYMRLTQLMNYHN